MTIHANKDDGLKCLAIAQRALDSGDVEKAKKFAEKAHRLYKCTETERLVKLIASTPTSTRAPSRSQSTASTTSATSTVKAEAAERAGRSTASTSDQERLVKTIRSKKCHYEILMISKTASDDEIKRAYRKLALKLHPDKNKAPGADEAFKMVSKAFSVLSSPQDRSHYDRYGDTEGMSSRGGFRGFQGTQPMYRGAPFNGVEVDAEELFRMFFGGNPFMSANFGGGGGARPRYYGRQQARSQQQQETQSSATRLLMSLAPIIMLLVFNLFSGSKSPYSLSQSREYPFPSSTVAHKIPFFVSDKAKFAKQYRQGSHERTRIEYQIESSWKEMMQRRCYQERLVKARWESYNQPEKAAKASLASCEALETKFAS
jgi:DnaJ family protein B protein 12